ncbi:PREDICTED: putative F-box protein At3g10790 [Camelina sativa]|uniref:F-box protein At3g10790 n=1 Tax=Camelina sativa TaxID=90675 RepID=A0ABM1RFB5_CAMSA|nr:PREDICTED: putative F-box protein At3g10790 [Camelina sativa]
MIKTIYQTCLGGSTKAIIQYVHMIHRLVFDVIAYLFYLAHELVPFYFASHLFLFISKKKVLFLGNNGKKKCWTFILRPIGYISSHPITREERKSRGIAMKRVKRENDPQIRDDNTSMADLPRDLIEKILLKLPAKSVPKLIVVSKLWSSIIRSKHFIDLYLERSLTRPRSLFLVERNSNLFFYSISQGEAATSSCTTMPSSFPMRLNRWVLSEGNYITPHVRGLICFQDSYKMVVSNPSTGQFLVLPKLNTRRKEGISRFFGYDPIGDEYKVLCMTVLQISYKGEPVVSEEHQVFTLYGGAQKKKKEAATWRMIKCKVPHCPVTKGLWMTNGVIYYGAWSNTDKDTRGSLVVRFDVRSEEFTLVKIPDGVQVLDTDSALVNYQGKVAFLNYSHNGNFDLRVLDDVVKQEWSKASVVVPSWRDLVELLECHFLCCRGITSSGELIFSRKSLHSDGRFFIVSYDPKNDVARRAEIEGFRDGLEYVIVLLDYTECPIIL